MYKNILLNDKFHFSQNIFFAQDEMFSFSLVPIQSLRDLFLSNTGTRYVPIIFDPVHQNEMHHFPHILPTPLSLSNATKPVNQSVGAYLSHPTQRFLSTTPFVHCHWLRPSEFMLPPRARSSTRSTSPSHTTSSTPHHN